MLKVRDLSFGYTTAVLKALSFDVRPGELLTVLGPNGSGKSTLLKIIVGILRPGSGSVLIGDRNLNSLSRRELARLVGYVAQETAVRFPLTAMELVLQGRFAQGRLLGFESDQDVRAAEQAMEMAGCGEFAGRLVSELSGGERQRVMLARALASQPRLLVLDEPVANLDVSHQVRTFELLRGVVAAGETSAVLVTHELNLAAEYSTSVLLLSCGTRLAYGPPAAVITSALLRDTFDADLLVDRNPFSGAPRVTLTGGASSSGSLVSKGGENNEPGP